MMQSFEYCAVGPIKTESSWWWGCYPKLFYFTDDGLKIIPIEKNPRIEEQSMMAMVISKLGKEGWEMVGTGSVENKDINNKGMMHYIYFKRSVAV
jgi:hypothetical protein